MDSAVAMVQAYLRVNGYFTVSEYPVIEATRSGYRTVTDLDILAFRFAGAGHHVSASGGVADIADDDRFVPDPALGITIGVADMVVGEVKEGRAELNSASTDPTVLRAALVRFGCCASREATSLVGQLLRDGHASLPNGHLVRMLVFGSFGSGDTRAGYTVITLGHVLAFLETYLRENWDVLRHGEQKDPAFGFLAMMHKARRGKR